jgi:hypothetical protein
VLTTEVLKEIIARERVKTLEDLLRRRLSILEDERDLSAVLGVPMETVRSLL